MLSDVDVINREKTWIFENCPISRMLEFLEERGVQVPLDKKADRGYLVFWIEQGVEQYVSEPAPMDTFDYYAPAYIEEMWARWKVKDWENYD